VGDVGDYWRESREHARRKANEAEMGVPLNGAKHRCGGNVNVHPDRERTCQECFDSWMPKDDGAEMVGPRMLAGGGK